MKINNYNQALNYVNSFIPKNTQKLYPGNIGLKRMKYFMTLLGNPQDKYKSIHIAGTSGKGSTAYLTSVLLVRHGFKVGLITKPHIFDIRERYLINNKLITNKEFVGYLNHLIPFIEKVKESKFAVPSYAEINTALAFVIFADQKVDYAVIETYLGGLYDCTNTITREDKVAVITKLGFDHTKILGNTLSSIAEQKAGIIHKNNKVISLSQKPTAIKVIQNKAKSETSSLEFVKSGITYKNVTVEEKGITFDYSGSGGVVYKNLYLSLFGKYQAENASLGLKVLLYLSERDGFKISEDLIRSTFKNADFPGRGNQIKLRNTRLIIDGAHNPQKMKEFINNLKLIYPDQKFTFLIGFVAGKDIRKMLNLIIPVADKIIVTGFFINHQDWIKKAKNPDKVVEILKKLNFYDCVAVPQLEKALQILVKDNHKIKIITGSLYLIGELYPLIKNT